MKAMVLILDDEANIRKSLLTHIKKAGYGVCAASTLEEANRIIQAESIDFAIIDLKIDYQSDYGGVRAIENVNKLRPKAKIIIVSAYELTSEIKDELSKVYYDSFIHKGSSGNYIRKVIDEIDKLKNEPLKKICFVIMPFSNTESCTKEQWSEIYETLIRQAVVSSGYNYECFRACLDIGNIIKDILVNLNRADIVIADLTDKNPNVFYELGVRHALRDVAILITQSIDDVPFDLRHYALIEYDWKTRRGRGEFNERIGKILGTIESGVNESNMVSPVREYLSLKTYD